MPSGLPRHVGIGQIVADVNEDRAGDMRLLIIMRAALVVAQGVAAIKDRPVGVAQVRQEIGGSDQGGVGHD